MDKYILAVDLGTTNFKFALFNQSMKQIAKHRMPVTYLESDKFVEFDPHVYVEDCKKGMSQVLSDSNIDPLHVSLIALTGQAESFVITDDQGTVLSPGISWKDNRSEKQVSSISKVFQDVWYKTTGLPEVSTTWPVTKLLWIREHKPELFKRIRKVFMLKDYVTYHLTEAFVTEYSVFSFSGMMNLTKRTLWDEMLDFIGLDKSVFPEFAEAGAIVGPLLPDVSKELSFSSQTMVCIGALDHVAGMIGTGNIQKGKVTMSLGTVNAMAINISSFEKENAQIECHSGAFPHSIIQLFVIDSGGVGIQWFHDNFTPHIELPDLDLAVESQLGNENDIIFLPYILGLNPPEYNALAKGVFFGFDVTDGPVQFARSIMESNCFLIRKSINHLERQTSEITEILAIGGAANSPFFCQLLADIIDKPVVTFKNPESTTLGAAMMGAVATHWYTSVEQAIKMSVERSHTYKPQHQPYYEKKFDAFNKLYTHLFNTEKGDTLPWL
ncbi:MAG: FGGY family carbohydrate kinase [Sphaerochaetaceae bacterium]|jgi:sugar (pentulose or hexulose) kinase